MKEKRRVVVTGMGVVSPIGNTVDEFWNHLMEGYCGIKETTAFDTTDYKWKLSAQDDDFDPQNYMDRKSARRMERFSQFAVAAAAQAIEDAGLDLEKEDRTRVGVSVGSGIGSLQAAERESKRIF